MTQAVPCVRETERQIQSVCMGPCVPVYGSGTLAGDWGLGAKLTGTRLGCAWERRETGQPWVTASQQRERERTSSVCGGGVVSGWNWEGACCCERGRYCVGEHRTGTVGLGPGVRVCTDTHVGAGRWGQGGGELGGRPRSA